MSKGGAGFSMEIICDGDHYHPKCHERIETGVSDGVNSLTTGNKFIRKAGWQVGKVNDYCPYCKAIAKAKGNKTHGDGIHTTAEVGCNRCGYQLCQCG